MYLPYEMQVQLQSGAVVPRWLVWVEALDQETGERHAAGFWSGDDDADFEINGEVRRYTAVGAMLSLPALTYEAGTNVQSQSLSFSLLSEEIEAAVNQYSLRLAPVEIHLVTHDPMTWEILGVARAFRGTVESATVKDGAKSDSGSSSTLELEVVSSSRRGTKTLAAKKSAASQRLRLETDRGRQYADMAGAKIHVAWGEEDGDGYFVRR
ncbi:MAG: hypothetical protein KDD97_10695 [Rhodobacteraceae bacterium]|nr:hypothetical protein [uncultured Defluviimonas sp.]MCB2126046.1 hypothetical protein [Paracoccaceae bacterium]